MNDIKIGQIWNRYFPTSDEHTPRWKVKVLGFDDDLIVFKVVEYNGRKTDDKQFGIEERSKEEFLEMYRL